eukprot:CAMPEP_0202907576 /NCGR_PEP_ID=MMETSP1392-20130828/43095_1 /ASSEMBLY_ACC=CAM_ASM_000868 /TAXON_ID=225041 /ORGANISM="Chlamydomonas chlamydogama, Strain SAG 11-48b" /LENGTH=63 /DNA_ID=CAMNT_0049596541 /DNA_START=370 /DNA_END=561 /DNA_ORIENTATION=-
MPSLPIMKHNMCNLVFAASADMCLVQALIPPKSMHHQHDHLPDYTELAGQMAAYIRVFACPCV